MLILRRFGPLFCWLKRVHADIFMLACALFNEQNKDPIVLSIIRWFTKCTSEKGLLRHKWQWESKHSLESGSVTLGAEGCCCCRCSFCVYLFVWLFSRYKGTKKICLNRGWKLNSLACWKGSIMHDKCKWSREIVLIAVISGVNTNEAEEWSLVHTCDITT